MSTHRHSSSASASEQIFQVISSNNFFSSFPFIAKQDSNMPETSSASPQKPIFKSSEFGGLYQLSPAFHESCEYERFFESRRRLNGFDSFNAGKVSIREQSSTDSAFDENSPEQSSLSRTNSVASHKSDEQFDAISELPNLRSFSKGYADMPRVCYRTEASRSYSVDSGYSTVSLLSSTLMSDNNKTIEEEDRQMLASEIQKTCKHRSEVDRLGDHVTQNQAAHRTVYVLFFNKKLKI